MKKNAGLPHRVETRIDEQKFLELQERLKHSNYNTISELLRDIIYDRKIITVTHDKSLDYLMEKLTAIRSEIHAIGVNINQVTKAFNSDPNPHMRIFYAKNIVEMNKVVGRKVEELLTLISNLGQKWLQK